ncbi:MAG: alcohol dehydrogenase [Desulfurella sp.]|uniref:iron-containing alcohol dehydrogenase n=1 Tax=Desulfurella sp. TaxID=1962857 RepID=UPI000CB7C197|nr:iron-containing alcohol dehydrogenase [Desulfurella sp.]PMP92908.1 MAG: alcohol dehydrogenase [Desulfurella sp.]
MGNIAKILIPEIIFGVNSINKAGKSLTQLGGEKPFIVTDEGIIKAGWLEKLSKILNNANLEYKVFSKITQNPKDFEINEGVKLYLSSKCDSIIGIGGGSSIDAAKAIAIIATNGGLINDYEGANKIRNPLPPMIMIPTTAGTGADVSQFAIVTDTKRKIKMSLIDRSLVPNISIIDPFLLTTKDPKLTANTGIDALSHAIESYLSVSANEFTNTMALNAIKIIFKYLRRSVASKTDLYAKEKMALASLQAGIAFSNAGLGLLHAMAHQVGGLLDQPHGEIDAILLPYVLEFNLIACTEKFVNIANVADEHIKASNTRELSYMVIKLVKELCVDLGIEEGLSYLGVNESNIPHLSKNALSDFCILTNPRDANEQDIQNIFQKAL